MRTRSQERAQFLADIIVCAVEGGTGYWACVSGYECPDDDPEATCATLHENDEDGELENEPRTWPAIALPPEHYSATGLHLSIEAVASALNKLSNGPVQYMSEATRSHLIQANRENDACNIDAGDADLIAQLALLGEIRYG